MGSGADQARRSFKELLKLLEQTEEQARVALKAAMIQLPPGHPRRVEVGGWLRDDDLDKMSLAEMGDLARQLLAELPETSTAASTTVARGDTGKVKPGERPPRQRPRH